MVLCIIIIIIIIINTHLIYLFNNRCAERAKEMEERSPIEAKSNSQIAKSPPSLLASPPKRNITVWSQTTDAPSARRRWRSDGRCSWRRPARPPPTYIYIYRYICICVSIYIYIYIYTYLSLSLYIYIYIYTSTHMCNCLSQSLQRLRFGRA